jgi:hypothetical protein
MPTHLGFIVEIAGDLKCDFNDVLLEVALGLRISSILQLQTKIALY